MNDEYKDYDSSIAPSKTSDLPFIPIEQIKKQFEYIEQIKREILVRKIDWYLYKGKPAYTRSGCSKLALIFNISTEILNKQRIEFINPKTNKIDIRWVVDVKASLPNGRYNDDGAGASLSEEQIEFYLGEHSVLCLAITRAKTRAIGGLVGGAITAEELPLLEEKTKEKKTTNMKVKDKYIPSTPKKKII